MDLEGKSFINFASNNYLGLAGDPRLKRAAHDALERWGAGATASRLLGGTLDLHGELERALADFKGTEACAVFPSGYHANLGALLMATGLPYDSDAGRALAAVIDRHIGEIEQELAGQSPTPDANPGARGIDFLPHLVPMTRGILDPHTFYYRRLITDAVRALHRRWPQGQAAISLVESSRSRAAQKYLRKNCSWPVVTRPRLWMRFVRRPS